jgi:hypothetical protein
VVGVRDQTGDGPEEGKRFDFEVSRFGEKFVLVKRDVRVVLFVDVEVFEETSVKEVVELHLFRTETLKMPIKRSVLPVKFSRKVETMLTSMCF